MRTMAYWMSVALTLGLFGVATAACDDDDAKKDVPADAAAPDTAKPAIGGTFTTAIAPTRALNTLTPAESKKVCEATTTYVGTQIQDPGISDMGCRIAGLISILNATDAEIKATCQKAYDACKAVPPPMMLPQDQCDDQPANSTCTATVAEYEACVGELPEDLKVLSRLIPACDKASKASLLVLAAGENLLGPACQALNKKCPEALGGISNLPSLVGGLPGRPKVGAASSRQ